MALKLQRANINLVENKLVLSPEWGSITGDITEQEDLIAALNSKADKEDIIKPTDDVEFDKSVTIQEGATINKGLNVDSIKLAGKPITNVFVDKTDYNSTTAQIQTAVEQKADKTYSYSKSESDSKYGLKTDYYTKSEIDTKINNLDLSIFEVVNELPTIDIDANKIYLVRNNQTEGSNLYTEYRYTNNSWEILGEYKSDIDLADYYTKSETDTLLANKANTADVYNKAEIDALITSGSSDLFIVTYTAENNTIDKTIAEINTARDEGKILIIKYVRTVYSDNYPRGVLYGYLQYNHNDYYYGDIRYLLTLYSIHINSGGGIDLQKTSLPNYNTTELTYYYTKTQTYSKSEIDTKIGDIESILATL